MAQTRVVISDVAGLQTVEYRDTVTAAVVSRGLEPSPGSAGANASVLATRARTALSQNATYLALPTPTAAQQTAQIDRLTRECSALLRLMLGATDSLADS